ncbi:MAG: hypothetical protein RMM17_12410 [Acidobacteriota bacterium]|nr:hypothetical protein [Blastocatellia bacterium]MDW8413473.1 hypothetical protein [Acidobacteriota bacterium]
MKRCPLCDRRWDDEKIFCPMDGHKLKLVATQSQVDTPKLGDSSSKERQREAKFELLSEFIFHEAELEKSLSQEPPPSLAKVADVAIEQLQARDLEELRKYAALYETFNIQCRTVHYFVEKLASESENFFCEIVHLEEYAKRSMIFNFSFGYGKYQRVFPLTVSYHREPRREVSVTIDLYEIAQDKDTRYLRTERIGGRVERLLSGFSYTISPPQGTEGVALLKWLDETFRKIVKAAYEVN